jgi:hypothetical protein
MLFVAQNLLSVVADKAVAMCRGTLAITVVVKQN